MKALRSCVDQIIGRTSLAQFAEVVGGVTLARQLPHWGRTVKAMDAYEGEYNKAIYLYDIDVTVHMLSALVPPTLNRFCRRNVPRCCDSVRNQRKRHPPMLNMSASAD
jgi:hypothetical protein